MSGRVTAEMLASIVQSVFIHMMDIEVSCKSQPWSSSVDRLKSSVHLTGDWSGTLLVECTPQQACLLAGRFLSMTPPDVVDDDVRDVLGELANMIGGNIKSVLVPGLTLSMPHVTDGEEYGPGVSRASVQARLAFQWGTEPFWVTLLTMTPEAHIINAEQDGAWIA